MFYTDRNPTILDYVDTNIAYSFGVQDDVLITKTSMIILVTYTTLLTYTTFALGERTAIDHCFS